MTRIYLSIVEIMAIHDDQIAVYGGSGGLRDPGHLEAAILRPQSGYYQNILEEAAALWEGLSKNHPFIDGNKRTALAAPERHNRLCYQPVRFRDVQLRTSRTLAARTRKTALGAGQNVQTAHIGAKHVRNGD